MKLLRNRKTKVRFAKPLGYEHNMGHAVRDRNVIC